MQKHRHNFYLKVYGFLGDIEGVPATPDWFLVGTPSNIVLYTFIDIITKFGAFVRHVTIMPKIDP